jgi:hypothetical protein
MHHEIDYNRYSDGNAARRKAINDLVSFVGKKRTAALIKHARHPEADLDRFQFYASFAGVSGFPVRALWAYASGRDLDLALLAVERAVQQDADDASLEDLEAASDLYDRLTTEDTTWRVRYVLSMYVTAATAEAARAKCDDALDAALVGELSDEACDYTPEVDYNDTLQMPWGGEDEL